MTYSETIDYLYARLPMFSRIGAAAMKKDLHNTIEICNILGNPQTKFPAIHVAGTNGKGSVSHMLAAILQTSGYKTGLYTSPHLYDFRERIKINGEMVTEDFVTAFTEKMRPHIETIEPSFFEITVGMAFEYFAKEQVDIAVIETGLGGRLDSTNVIHPVLSVITNIGWDHMNILGDSLDKIASEKAGIIKENIPAVIGETQDELKHVFTTAAEKNKTQVYFADDNFSISNYKEVKGKLVVETAQRNNAEKKTYTLDLPGIYQLKNLCTVLMATTILRSDDWDQISDESIEMGLYKTRSITGLHGRWEKISEHPTVILEAAHNVNGVKEMMRHLQNLAFRKLHFILGAVRDKDISSMLELFPESAHYYFTQADIPRALEAAALKDIAAAFGLKGDAYPDVNAALEKAKSMADENDLVIVSGSIFLIAEVKRKFD